MKTLGPRAAQLVTELNELRRSTFTLSDVRSITGLSAASARNLVHKAQQRGLVTRLKPGLYNLVPFELGRATEHIDSPYLIARELAGAAPYFLSHGTALELHRMVTQPNFTVYVSCTRRVRPQTVGGYDFRFVHITAEQEFGVMKHWIDKERFVMISDMGTVHEKHKEWKYNNALEAATAYNAFEDHGFACCGRTIWLYEPDGTVHHKTFLTRGVDPVTRERLGYNSPVPS